MQQETDVLFLVSETPKGSVIYGPDGAEISVGGAVSLGGTTSVDAGEAKSDLSESQKPLDLDGRWSRLSVEYNVVMDFI